MRRDPGNQGRIRWAAATGAVMSALLGVAGCGQVTPPEAGVALSAAPDEIAQTVCPKAYSCCTASELMGNDLAGTDEASCEVATAKSFGDQLSAVQDSERAGRARYDGTRVAACLATIRSSTCEALGATNHLSGIPGCESFVVPLVGEGGDCGNDWECKVGRCNAGKCQTQPAAGEACADGHCAAGAVCDPAGMCVAARADGESCTEAAQCPSLQCTNSVCAPRAHACFYSSGCAVAGDSAAGGIGACLTVMLLMVLALVRARRPVGAPVRSSRRARSLTRR
jgi:hypothetical protein